MTNPSPAAQAVLKAVQATLPDYMLTDRTAGCFAATALESVADNWKSEISGQPPTEFMQGINNCIAALQEIAAELEGHQ